MRWLPLTSVRGFEQFEGYFVTDTGQVWSKKRGGLHQLKPYRGDYNNVWIYGKYKTSNVGLGRLVACAFVERPKGALTIRFKDGDRDNCSADNLMWVIRKPKSAWKKKKKPGPRKKPKRRKRKPGPKPKRWPKRTIVRQRSKYYILKNSIVVGKEVFTKMELIKQALDVKTGQQHEFKAIVDEIIEYALIDFVEKRGLKKIMFQLQEQQKQA